MISARRTFVISMVSPVRAASAEHLCATRLDAIREAEGSWTEESLLSRETVQTLNERPLNDDI